MENNMEYFAESLQSFFDAKPLDDQVPETRELLRTKDPEMHTFLVKYLGNNPWKDKLCPKWGPSGGGTRTNSGRRLEAQFLLL